MWPVGREPRFYGSRLQPRAWEEGLAADPKSPAFASALLSPAEGRATQPVGARTLEGQPSLGEGKYGAGEAAVPPHTDVGWGTHSSVLNRNSKRDWPSLEPYGLWFDLS